MKPIVFYHLQFRTAENREKFNFFHTIDEP